MIITECLALKDRAADEKRHNSLLKRLRELEACVTNPDTTHLRTAYRLGWCLPSVAKVVPSQEDKDAFLELARALGVAETLSKQLSFPPPERENMYESARTGIFDRHGKAVEEAYTLGSIHKRIEVDQTFDEGFVRYASALTSRMNLPGRLKENANLMLSSFINKRISAQSLVAFTRLLRIYVSNVGNEDGEHKELERFLEEDARIDSTHFDEGRFAASAQQRYQTIEMSSETYFKSVRGLP